MLWRRALVAGQAAGMYACAAILERFRGDVAEPAYLALAWDRLGRLLRHTGKDATGDRSGAASARLIRAARRLARAMLPLPAQGRDG